MPTCPRCLYSFFPTYPGEKSRAEGCRDLVFCHDCIGGYYRPYPQECCTLCRASGVLDNTKIMSYSKITENNRARKQLFFQIQKESRAEEAS